MKAFGVFSKGQVVWVPRAVLLNGAARRTASDNYIECEVLQASGVTSPSVHLVRTDLADDLETNPDLVISNSVWVNKLMIETIRPK